MKKIENYLDRHSHGILPPLKRGRPTVKRSSWQTFPPLNKGASRLCLDAQKKNVFHIQKTGATYSNSLRMRRFQPIPPPLFLLPQLLPTPPTPHRWYHPVPNVQSHLCQWQKDYHHLLAPQCAAPQVCFVPNSLVISSQNHFGRTQVHQNTTMASSFLLVKLEVLAGQKV